MKQARLADYFKQNQDIKSSASSSSRIISPLLNLRNPSSKTLQRNNNPSKLNPLNESQVVPSENLQSKGKAKKKKRNYGDGILSEFPKKLKLTSDQFSSLKDKSSLKLSTEKDNKIKYVKPLVPKQSEAGLSGDEQRDFCPSTRTHGKNLTDGDEPSGSQKESILNQNLRESTRTEEAEAPQKFEQEEAPMTSFGRRQIKILRRNTDSLETHSEILKEKEETLLECDVPKIVRKSNRGCKETLVNGKLVTSKFLNDSQNNKEIQDSQNNADKVFSEPSIRDKYEDLLKTERDFVLPLSYKKLLEILKGLDMTINFFMIHQKPLWFSDLAQSLRKSLKIEVRESHLAQMKYAVAPCLYQILWMKNEKKKGNWDLYIKFPNDENEKSSLLSTKKLEERQAILKGGLLEVTKKHHLEFLKSINAEKYEKKYERQRCWDSRFRVNECPPVPEDKLPDRPDQEPVVTVEEFLREAEIKNRRVKQAMEEAVKKAEKDQAKKFCQKNKSGISEKILLKVRAKEFALASKEKGNNGVIQMMKEDLKRVAEILKVYFTLRNVSSMYLVQIMQHLSKGQDKCIIGKDEAERYIRELIRLCPEWLSLKVLSNLHIITTNKSISMSCIYESIEKRLE